MKYLTSAMIAGMLIASPVAAQKVGVASDNVIIEPAPEGGLLGGSLAGPGIIAVGALAAIALVAAAGSSGGGGSSSTTTTE